MIYKVGYSTAVRKSIPDKITVNTSRTFCPHATHSMQVSTRGVYVCPLTKLEFGYCPIWTLPIFRGAVELITDILTDSMSVRQYWELQGL